MRPFKGFCCSPIWHITMELSKFSPISYFLHSQILLCLEKFNLPIRRRCYIHIRYATQYTTQTHKYADEFSIQQTSRISSKNRFLLCYSTLILLYFCYIQNYATVTFNGMAYIYTKHLEHFICFLPFRVCSQFTYNSIWLLQCNGVTIPQEFLLSAYAVEICRVVLTTYVLGVVVVVEPTQTLW